MRLIAWPWAARTSARRQSSALVPVRVLAVAFLMSAGLAGSGTPLAAAASSSLAQASLNVHTVEPGETVRSIAAAYGVSSETVLAANALDNPDLLQIGDQLVVPAVDGALHTVEPGETLVAIAADYGVAVADLVSANALTASPDLLSIGTVLVVPGVHPALPDVPQRVARAAPAPIPTPAPAVATPAPAVATPAPAEAASADRVITARVTGYAAGAGAVSAHTASGTTAHWGTLAADTHLFPFGTRVRIDGLGDTVFVVEDTGSAVRGNVFDVWFPDSDGARQLGETTRQVTILGPEHQ